MEPKLVLHFDINGTITVVDSTEDCKPTENINMTLARNVYGKVIDEDWILNENHNDKLNSITYYDYLKTNGDRSYKLKSFIFTEKGQPGERIRYLYDKILPMSENFLFPSFRKVLKQFPSALIVLRSFGKDIPDVLKDLASEPGFVNTKIGRIRYLNDFFSLSFPDGSIYTDPKDLNTLYITSKNHMAIHDDYTHWNDHKRDRKYGKIILSDERLLQIFFDDNDCVNITGEKNCHYVQINTIDALVNEDYYINKIRNIIKNSA